MVEHVNLLSEKKKQKSVNKSLIQKFLPQDAQQKPANWKPN